MASAQIIPADSGLTLCFVESENAQAQPVEIVGYQVNDKGIATPVTYPSIPSKAQVFVQRDGGYKPFDLETGRTTGATQSGPKWVKA